MDRITELAARLAAGVVECNPCEQCMETAKELLKLLQTPPTQGYEPDQTPMSVSPDWKSDGTGFRDSWSNNE